MSARRILAAAKDAVVVEPMDLPQPGPGQVVVEAVHSAISPGTELAWIGGKPNTPGEFPFEPGYATCGRIVSKADDVDAFEAGQTVVCPTPHASHAAADAASCRPVPVGMSTAEASMYHLVSIALQAVRKGNVRLGWDVAVVGLGPIGHFAGQIARCAGATHVEGIDTVDWRRELALQCGYDAAADAMGNASKCCGETASGYHTVLEATGTGEAVNGALGLARRRGVVVLLGSSRGNTENVDFYADVHRTGIMIVGAHVLNAAKSEDVGDYCTKHTDDMAALKLIAAGRVNVAPLIGDVMSPDDAGRAYDRLRDRREKLMTIVFDWS